MSCGTLVPATAFFFSFTRLLRSLARLSSLVQLRIASVFAGPQPQKACSLVWAPSLSLAATQEIDVSFSSFRYLDVSVPGVPSAWTMDSSMGDRSSTCRVSPFGDQGIYACLRLPLAFRSLPRPSSALGALASTLCSSSLNYFILRLVTIFRSIDLILQLVFSRLFLVLNVRLSRCAGDPSPFQGKTLVVGRSGLEPPTSRLSGECSNRLS